MFRPFVRREHVDVTAICRLCLCEPAAPASPPDDQQMPAAGAATTMVSIFHNDDENCSLPLRIMTCLALEVQPTDALPKHLCAACRHQLEQFYWFRKKAQNNDSMLRRHLRLCNAGKPSRVFAASDDEHEDDYAESRTLLDRWDAQRTRAAAELERTRRRVEQAERDRIETELRRRLEVDLRAELEQTVRDEMESKWRQLWGDGAKVVTGAGDVGGGGETVLIATSTATAEMPLVAINEEDQHEDQQPDYEYTFNVSDAGTTDGLAAFEIDDDGRIMGSDEFVRSGLRREVSSGGTATGLMDRDDMKLIEYLDEVEAEEEEDEHVLEEQLTECVDGEAMQIDELEVVEEMVDEEAEEVEEDEVQGDEDFITYSGSQYDHGEEHTDDDHTEYHEVIDDTDDTDPNYEPPAEPLPPPLKRLPTTQQQSQRPLSTAAVRRKNEFRYTKLKSTGGCTQVQVATGVGDAVLLVELVHSNAAAAAAAGAVGQQPGGEQYHCAPCGLKFERRLDLGQHEAAVHARPTVHVCEFCDRMFPSNSSLVRHVRTHTGEKPFACDVCGRTFIQKEILKRHLQVHTGERPFGCVQCERTFTQRELLRQHVNRAHSESPVIDLHKCAKCDKSFYHSSGLSRHMLMHTGKKFVCEHCAKQFNDKSALRRHVGALHAGMAKGE